MDQTIVLDVNGESSLVFGGITWKPLIGSNLAGQSEKFAVTSKATHFVAAGEHSAAVGIIKLSAIRAKEEGRAFYSAAAVFAQAHQSGVLITTQEFPNGRVWIVAAHNGVVISDTDVLLTNIEAEALIAEIKSRHKNAIEIEGEFETLQHLNSKTQLIAVRNAFQKIPNSLKLFAGFLVILLIADTFWSQYKQYKKREARELEASQYIDAHSEWENALHKWAASIKPDGRVGLIGVYEDLGNTPMKVEGWNLSEANCATSPLGWDCSARYEAGVGATNLGFKQNMPTGWTASWDGLTGAIGSWSTKVERSSIDLAAMQAIQDFSLYYISSLQRVLPALRKVELSPPAHASIPAPEVYMNRGQGEELVTVPYPTDNTAGIELPSVQTFEIEGPLRTLSVLPMIDNSVIKKLRFIVGSQGSTPALRDSIFTAKLTGEFYVR